MPLPVGLHTTVAISKLNLIDADPQGQLADFQNHVLPKQKSATNKRFAQAAELYVMKSCALPSDPHLVLSTFLLRWNIHTLLRILPKQSFQNGVTCIDKKPYWTNLDTSAPAAGTPVSNEQTHWDMHKTLKMVCSTRA